MAAFFPESRLWGINWYGFLGWYGQTALLLAGLGMPLGLSLLLRRAELEMPTASSRPLLWTTIGGLSFLVLALLLRARTHFLGDGYQVLAKVQSGAEFVKPWDLVTWTIQRGLYLAYGGTGETAARLALQTLSIICGLAIIAVTVYTAHLLFRDWRARLLFVLGAVSGGYGLLYFGYIENYPLFVTTVHVAVCVGLLVARGLLNRWVLPLLLLAALCLHPFGVMLLPGGLYVLLGQSRLGIRLPGLSRAIKVVLTLTILGTILAFAVFRWHTDYFFRFALVPPVTDHFTVEGYTLFSIKHLLDFANLLVMLAPGSGLGLVALFSSPVRRWTSQSDYRFLAITLFVGLVLAFVFNPRLGMPRDWDLFCFVGVPIVLGLFYFLLDERHRRPDLIPAAGLAVILALLILVPRALTQSMPKTSIAVFDSYARLDVIKSRNGRFLLQQYLKDQGRVDEYQTRARTNAAALPHENLSETARRHGEEGRLDEAVDMFRRALQRDPGYPYAWSNLGVVYRWMGNLDSALICLKIADGLNPYSFSTYMKLAGTYYARDECELAEEYWNRALVLTPGDLEARGYLLKIYHEQERWAEYDGLLAELLAEPDAAAAVYEEAGRLAIELSDYPRASKYYREAIRRGMDSASIFELLEANPQLHLDVSADSL
jgi:Tfp pilus assembly protein PilF